MPQKKAAEEDTRKPPLWLNSAFLTKALRQGLKDPTLRIKTLDIKPATAPGDNYVSIMFRATMSVTKSPTMNVERLSVVVKTLPKGDLIQDFAKSLFNREAAIFQVILPDINKRLKSVLPDHDTLNARFIWYGKDPEPVLVLEDLKELGFSMADRMEGLDKAATNMALEALAKMHAASLAVAASDPEKLKSVEDNIWIENESLSVLSYCGLLGLVDEVSHWDDFPKDRLQKITDFRPHIKERLRDALKYDESCLNVLIHGDCWVNNTMLVSKNGKIDRLRLVDFQLCCISSAAIDLNYFIFTSPNLDIRLDLDEMLMTYYTKFMDTVNKLNIELNRSFTFEDLRNDFRRRSFFGFISAMVSYPITVAERIVEVNYLFDENQNHRPRYQNERFRKMFLLSLPYFTECGIL